MEVGSFHLRFGGVPIRDADTARSIGIEDGGSVHIFHRASKSENNAAAQPGMQEGGTRCGSCGQSRRRHVESFVIDG